MGELIERPICPLGWPVGWTAAKCFAWLLRPEKVMFLPCDHERKVRVPIGVIHGSRRSGLPEEPVTGRSVAPT